ncbi:MAG: glutamate--cysteine ligase [Gilliamella sp.]|uniref:glutamate--cysteine ligase n=1 Tax=Gilliamella sp. TaxID=1891236 RepID=UPI00261A54F1|nr:glutamate--cysteine ligase [Gilliamella sp.]MCO6551982.1 glutamate--cysteine ligase [Gilliamella sp.]MCO6560402.1 glutamate--cysteine ligase [Gilliamella sp.]
MIPDVSKALSWLEKHYTILQGIQRGIERETLRILPDGSLSKTPFPSKIGAALTHPWITTDFAESMLEFITPVNTNIDYMLTFLRDLHRYASVNIGDEMMWPLSMPCFVANEKDIILAQYGTSNEGRFKTIYREGLKNRYGAMMQTISGVHYNFSLPTAFWQAREGVKNTEEGKAVISEGYFTLIRNYYRFGWVIPYLFGASPSMCSSFIQDPVKAQAFIEQTNGNCYLPYATSLRLSDIGYTNNAQKQLGITFNHLETYVEGLKRATRTESADFAKLGIKVDGHYRQLNDNVLQIENEFYAPIRPKRVPMAGESPSDALLRGGIEYIEVRALDVNPFSPIGITEDQIRFIDLFLIWCALAPAPEMSSKELECAKLNWNRVIIEGRKPGLEIGIGCESNREPLSKVGHELFKDLLRVADVLDHQDDMQRYRNVCERLDLMFDQPELTLSARTLQAISDLGTAEFGIALANQYKKQLMVEPLALLTEGDFVQQRNLSIEKQVKKEQNDTLSFDQYLKKLNDKNV